jgi:type II secretory pathway pseudopilin PulG
MIHTLRQPCRRASSGFTIVETLVASLIVVLTIVSSATLVTIANRRAISTRQLVEMQRSIDDNISEIKVLARRYTCCSGVCTTASPATISTTTPPAAPNAPCLTRDWRSSSYYYPAMDLPTTTLPFANTTTSSEPSAVDQLCDNPTNISPDPFMTPFQDAVNLVSTAQLTASNVTRATEIQSDKVLRVTFTDTINNRVARQVYIRPTMASFCT